MGRHASHTDGLALAVAASVTSIHAREAEARQRVLDRCLHPMREVTAALNRLHGPDAQPLDHRRDFASLDTEHGAEHLRERDVQQLQAAMVESADRDCARGEALDDLAAAREASSEAVRLYDETSMLAWVGMSREQFLAVVEMALRHPPPVKSPDPSNALSQVTVAASSSAVGPVDDKRSRDRAVW